MDNASKALIIAGEVLIAILVLSLMAYMFIAFGNFSAKMHEHMTESQRTEFNSHFLTLENRINITAQEIATVINYAKQMNDARDLEYRSTSEYYTTVLLDGVVGNTPIDVFNHSSFVNDTDKYNNKLQSILTNFIKNNNIYYFSCNATVSKKDDDLKIDYGKDNEEGISSTDIIYNEKTGLINKITFHKIDPDIINVLTYRR